MHARSAQSEDSGTVEAAEVRLSNPISWRFEVQFSFEDGAATSGDDFEGVERRNLTIPGGRTIVPIPATYVDDDINEETEAYSVRLHSTTDRASLGSPSTAEVQILDDDPLGEPRVPPTSATEGEDLAFEVRLERTASRAIEVDYAVSGGTAREGLDFETVEPGTLTFLPETEFLVVRVPTRDDEMDEATESVVIELTDEHGVTVSAEGMIVVDDEEPALTLTSSRAEESAGSVDFEVTMSGNETERTVAVLYETVEGTAEESVDYHATAGVVTFAPGSRHTVLAVPVVADNHNEPDEEIFRLVLSEPEHASVTESEAIGTILDSDGNPEFSVAATVGPEGSELGFEINLSPSSESHQFVDYSTRDGTATRDLDYLAASGRLEFLPRTRVQTVFVETLADAISEPDEDLLLVLEIPDALSVGTPDRATLAVDGAEARGRIEGSAAGLSVTGGSALESDGELVFQVTLNSAAVDTVTVDYATEDGTAQSGADYARTELWEGTWNPKIAEKWMMCRVCGPPTYALAQNSAPANIKLFLTPADSRLLYDVVRVLTRLLGEARERLGPEAVAFRDHGRAAKRRALEIRSSRGAERRAKLYRRLLDLVRRTRGYAEAARPAVASVRAPWARSWTASVRELDDLAERVVDQTRRRVFDGETVPAGEKVASLFEPHTDIIRKGGRRTHYGHKINLTTGRSGLVLDAVVEDGNPADSERCLPMLERHAARYDAAPTHAAFDGGYATKANLADAKELGVAHAVFHKKRGLRAADMTPSAWVYARLWRFRAGIEAGISHLKRCFGLGRCNWRGLEHFKAYVLSAVFAHNLMRLVRLRPG